MYPPTDYTIIASGCATRWEGGWLVLLDRLKWVCASSCSTDGPATGRWLRPAPNLHWLKAHPSVVMTSLILAEIVKTNWLADVFRLKGCRSQPLHRSNRDIRPALGLTTNPTSLAALEKIVLAIIQCWLFAQRHTAINVAEWDCKETVNSQSHIGSFTLRRQYRLI